MSKKISKNYLDYIPVKNPEVEYETAENGRVTVFIEWKGFITGSPRSFSIVHG